jgi:sugar phosphate isomerase/epimerase
MPIESAGRSAILCTLSLVLGCTCEVTKAEPQTHLAPPANSLWSLDNLVAWSVVPFDAKQRNPEERAQMLEGLGFKHFAYSWRASHIPSFDAEIQALKEHHIELLAWALYGSESPELGLILDTFRRHSVHPQLWVEQSNDAVDSPQQWARVLPKGFRIPETDEDYAKLSPGERQQLDEASLLLQREDLPTTVEAQRRRVELETDRIRSLVKRAAPYGVKIELYNHNGWFGTMDNQVAIIQRLRDLGIVDVGIVYNFSHARDALHDDTGDFSRIWKEIQPYTVVVNVTGTHMDGTVIYPSQGDRELEMMRVIQDSGWKGHIGVIAESGGDAERTLKNCITGLDWLAAELIRSGSGGPRPFDAAPKEPASRSVSVSH